jgi:hypothetical protein
MSEPVIARSTLSAVSGARLQRIADVLAVAVAASLPWSVSATSILVVLWLLTLIPTLEISALRRALLLPAGGLPVALVLLGVVGMAWADVSWADRLHGLNAFAKLAVIPLLMVQFRRSDWGPWVLVGFLVSCTLLLLLSWAFVLRGPLDPSAVWTQKQPGIPVKDYIAQSGNFTLCAFALIDQALARWKDRRESVGSGPTRTLVPARYFLCCGEPDYTCCHSNIADAAGFPSTYVEATYQSYCSCCHRCCPYLGVVALSALPGNASG